MRLPRPEIQRLAAKKSHERSGDLPLSESSRSATATITDGGCSSIPTPRRPAGAGGCRRWRVGWLSGRSGQRPHEQPTPYSALLASQHGAWLANALACWASWLGQSPGAPRVEAHQPAYWPPPRRPRAVVRTLQPMRPPCQGHHRSLLLLLPLLQSAEAVERVDERLVQ